VTEVLVVHAIDTEGPLGGDARRRPDGSAEFFDNWPDIHASLAELTDPAWRAAHADADGNPYVFNWFVLDFTGFRTNPKERIAEYHDTWDNIVALPTEIDGRYWHYHAPPPSGVGDEWAATWLSSGEHNTILVRRLLERGSFPAAFRAGGTIEDQAASYWLEHAVPIDFSNRVSERSRGDSDLYGFDWHGAPARWGSYHPSHASFLEEGRMRRFIYRSLDLRSRYNEITQAHVDECFAHVAATGAPAVFSFFSHDNRDMRPETVDVVKLLRIASELSGVPWRSCTAVEAHRLYHGLEERPLALEVDASADEFRFRTDAPPFQSVPFVGAETEDGRFVRLYPRSIAPTEWRLAVPTGRLARLAAAVTSEAGDVTVVTA
jgi:hypothetical protein